MSAHKSVSFPLFRSQMPSRLQIVLTLTVVAEGHFGLAQTNGVFARSDAIELLEFSLVDALQMGWSVVSV
jgi:hypothetical protein